jgi:energy-coupling factor transporter ATP-binding protein EcfA2
MTPALLVVTGASGAGKTTLVRAIEGTRPGVSCYYFDSIGVPSLEEMTLQFGGPEAWQRVMTEQWIHRLAANPDGARLVILDAQTRPSFVVAAFDSAGVRSGRILLVDCSPEARRARLTESRAQPELAGSRMDAWAAYLRGQADALGLAVLDTTSRSIPAATELLLAQVDAMLREPQSA